MKNILSLIVFVLSIQSCENKDISEDKTTQPVIQYEFPSDKYEVSKKTLNTKDTFISVLLSHNVKYSVIARIIEKSKGILNFKNIKPGEKYLVLSSKGSIPKLQMLIYEDSPTDYVVFDLRDSISIYKRENPISIRERTSFVEINNSISKSVVENKLDYELVNKLSEIYAWTIDFFSLQKGDSFKIIYDEVYVNDTSYVRIDKVKAINFFHGKKNHYAFRVETDNLIEYFDENGKNLRKSFLRAPLKYARITSMYSRRRFHPVLKMWKSHKGTDYAAPRNTPILATANGTITKVGYSKGNGNYVTIRHNSIYSTQYLHMNKFKKGINKNTRVKQGDVIGYVGSTGYATGPHVCYRFWKNGVQINPMREKFPDANPIKKEHEEKLKANYQEYFDRIQIQVD
ncbi:M23 family metallopeptidase [Ichthyobacterium seriolicida]|uniref:Peptidase M23 n=1 Tax=Ichthyobacterium seriolicida TaxID=242600 RepID=A0A1J1DZT9_9FLAO|nr:peptidoglycan DD-metalloendopeptidase family protein [Ichthyobacterium seriolicida]BAV95447.1 peptidase M23 [Ichthyobacterium seriolicida]